MDRRRLLLYGVLLLLGVGIGMNLVALVEVAQDGTRTQVVVRLVVVVVLIAVLVAAYRGLRARLGLDRA
ncbi:hypothetical protein [Nocardioides sp. AX2bis]|uniref:hypothetical protein n=1 Tax=Nocardioides sp. AX2bis TaxID=2653157 RepID=UPI0012EF9690|nr:hypothetical protein [Nocardioides sp. AX2bis]VXC43421.1 hypothetical protein NOCARDAX2BIS_560004 [Nocardioides sp. AX2bis]